MTSEEVNKLFDNIFKTDDKLELLNFSLKIEKMVKNDEMLIEDSHKLYLAVHAKENEMAIMQILEMINDIALSSADEAGIDIKSPRKDKLH